MTSHEDDWDDDDDEEFIGPPYSIVIGQTNCYRCGADHSVAAIAGWIDEDVPCFAMYITELPDALLQTVQTHVNFKQGFSRTAGHDYFANHCPHCNALSGDHFLHQAGGVFGPMTPEDAEELQVISVHQDFDETLQASVVVGGSLDWILSGSDL